MESIALKRAVCNFLENVLMRGLLSPIVAGWPPAYTAGQQPRLPACLMALWRCFVNCSQQTNYKNKEGTASQALWSGKYPRNQYKQGGEGRGLVKQSENGAPRERQAGHTTAPGKQMEGGAKSKQDCDNPGTAQGSRLEGRQGSVCNQPATSN